MLNYASRQMIEFLYSALFGISCGMLYDISSLIRLYLKGKKIACALIDLLFCAICVVALFAFLLLVTEGRLRWYVMLAIGLGFFIYKNTISGLFFYLIRSIIKTGVRVLNLSVLPIYKFSDYLKTRIKLKGCEAENGKETEKKT